MNDMFFTSLGPRRGSQIRQVAGGTRARQTERGWEIRTLGTDAWRSIDHEPGVGAAAEAGGWQSWSNWTNQTQNPVVSFVSEWTVPVPPPKANGQTIYLFNGLLDAAGHHIVQPVLQWGPSPARGSTNAWGLASFWVGGPHELMFTTHWTEVAPGTVVAGRLTLQAQNNGLFSCTAEFDGYPATQLTSENLPPMVQCVLTLEAYGTGPNAPYPNVSFTEFSAISIAPDLVAANVRWVASGGAVIRKDGGTGARVDVAYPAIGS